MARKKTLSLTFSAEKETENSDSRKSTVLSFLRGNSQVPPSSNQNLNPKSAGDNSGLNVSGISDNGSANILDLEDKTEEGLKKGSKSSSSSHVEVCNFFLNFYFYLRS